MAITKLDIALAALGLVILQRLLSPKKSSNLPPGPPGLPLLGNAADMPTKKEWETYAEWGQKYGGILSVQVMGRPIIIVNSYEIMQELDKKGSIYSDRPKLEMGGELLGYSETLVLIPYGDRFRTYRKHFLNFLGPQPIEKQKLLIQHETHRFLKRQLSHPVELMDNLRKRVPYKYRSLAGGVILGITYGIKVQEDRDPFVDLIEGANANFSAATVPGAYLVDFFPSLKKLPEWLPGMGFMETARRWAKDTAAMVEVPYAYTKKQMASGSAPSSFVSTMLEDEASLTQDQIRDIKLAACSMYGGGADTTVSAEYAFFLAMVLFPDVFKKAQAELDSVIGRDRLPTLEDRPHLPYINAVMLEVIRWNSVAPTGVPHTAMEDGHIGGYFVPKGAMILCNLWAMLHDPEVYADPFEFRPERHLAEPGKPAERDPRTVCFGYGRRVCPGMHLAEASLFSAVSNSLAIFDISKAVENGVEITPAHENTSGIISYPEQFKCSVKPRSEKAFELVSQALDQSQI